MSRQRIKYLYRVADERAGDSRNQLMAVSIHYGVVPRETLTADLPRAEDLTEYKICERGDIVLNRMRAFQGAIGISPQRGIVSPDYLILRPNRNSDPRYLHYLFRSAWFVGEMTSRLRGIGNTENGSVRTPRINSDDLGDIRADIPSIDEQRCVANFLDSETTRIDKLGYLQARVQAAIDARTAAHVDHMFDDLSSNYDSSPFRRMIRSIEQGISPLCDNVPAASGNWGVLKVSAVRNGSFLEDENKQLPADIPPERRYEIEHGDLLITRANTPLLVGSATIADHPRSRLMLCDKIFRIKTTNDLLPEFLVFASLTTRIRAMCASASHGTSQSMVNLRAEEIKRWPVPMAPLSVQRAAIAELREARGHAAKLTAAIGQQLTVLSERRQALITAAVTGQIDVTTGGVVA